MSRELRWGLRWIIVTALLAVLAATDGCGQSGPLMRPGSVQSPPTEPPPAGAEEPDSQEDEQAAE